MHRLRTCSTSGSRCAPLKAPPFFRLPALCTRRLSTKSPPKESDHVVTNAGNPDLEDSKSTQRFERVLNRTPKFLRGWIQPIANKPISHLTSFLILHEITAVVPLIGLTYIFHKAQWTPQVLPEEWIAQGAKKGERLIYHYGINVHGEQLVRLAFEFAAAYATVKALMPARIALSAWLTPWFSRWFTLPVVGLFRRSVNGSATTVDKTVPK